MGVGTGVGVYAVCACWFVCPSCVPLVRVSVVSVGVNFD